MTALRFAAPIRCHRELEVGEVKRIGRNAALVGYYLRCPGCRALLQAAAEDVEETLPLIEQPAGPGISARVMRPMALRTCRPVACRCGGAVSIRDERVELAA